MDGFAVQSRDFSHGRATLTKVAEIPAGQAWDGRLGRGECARIMTGAPVPAGADAVVKIEETRALEGRLTLLFPGKIAKGTNVHPKGADAPKGKTVLAPGTLLTGLHAAALASFGVIRATVTRPLRVHLLTTGAEVVPPGRSPLPWQIRNANGPGVAALFLPPAWASCRFHGIAPDRERALGAKIEKTLENCDVAVVTGGVSAGDYDFVPKVLAALGVKNIFHRIAMRPGRPLWFGLRPGGPAVFGIPGNPVSNFVTAHEFLFPALRMIAGFSDPAPHALYLPMARNWTKTHNLEEARVARLTRKPNRTTAVDPIDYSGSGDFTGALPSDGLAFLPAKAHEIAAETLIEFHPWRFL
jgi:molybdopterin molybdotransferase